MTRISRLLSVALPLLLCTPAAARTWHIAPDGSGDAPTIQAGIDSAGPGDDVLLEAGVYTWASQHATGSLARLKSGVTLHSEAGAAATVLDAESHGRVIVCQDVGDGVRIDGLTIAHGNVIGTGGGILVAGASNPTIAHCVLQHNRADIPVNGRGGAGISCDVATILYCDFLDNVAFSIFTALGGGIYCGAARIDHCTFLRNGCTVGDSQAGSAGGAIYSHAAQIADCTFEGNFAGAFVSGVGGAIEEAGVASIERCVFRSNTANLAGGAIGAQSGSITSCLFVDNKASGTFTSYPSGGAVRAGSVTISGCAFLGNVARHVRTDGPGFGGAVNVDQGTIESCTLVGNSGGTSAGIGGLRLGSGTIRNTIVAGTTAGATCAGSPSWMCCDLYGNVAGDAICGTDGGDNFSADPQFCVADPVTSLNVTIQSDSPCALGNHPNGASCGLIGTGPVGCGTVSVQQRTWSEVKSLYNYK